MENKQILAKYYDKEHYVFIFNPEQKNFYLKYIKMVDSATNPKTKMQYWIFDKKESNPIYTLWLNECKKNKK